MIKFTHKQVHGYETRENAAKFAWFLVDHGLSCVLSAKMDKAGRMSYMVEFRATNLEYQALLGEKIKTT